MGRACFVFSDSLEVGGYLGFGQGEGMIEEHELTAANLAVVLPTQCFAGIVCVADLPPVQSDWTGGDDFFTIETYDLTSQELLVSPGWSSGKFRAHAFEFGVEGT